jgi:hypothetical protein
MTLGTGQGKKGTGLFIDGGIPVGARAPTWKTGARLD